jgi:hypothetical protein
MAARFARVPFGQRLHYPAVCPFTGVENPKKFVRVMRSEGQLWVPIPFVGLFSLNKAGQMMFPASTWITGMRVGSEVALWLCLVGGIGYGVFSKEDPNASHYMFGGILSAIVMRVFQWLLLCRVRIVRIGMNSLEVRFASETYAKEFCRLNDLSCRSRSMEKRVTPITLNDLPPPN